MSLCLPILSTGPCPSRHRDAHPGVQDSDPTAPQAPEQGVQNRTMWDKYGPSPPQHWIQPAAGQAASFTRGSKTTEGQWTLRAWVLRRSQGRLPHRHWHTDSLVSNFPAASDGVCRASANTCRVPVSTQYAPCAHHPGGNPWASGEERAWSSPLQNAQMAESRPQLGKRRRSQA